MRGIINYSKDTERIKEAENKIDVLTFRIKDNIYGIDIKYIDGVTEGLTKNKSRKEKNIYSIVEYRDKVIALLDLYTYLYGIENEKYKEVSNHQIIIKVNENKLGLEVSQIKGIISIDKRKIVDVIPLLKDSLYMVNGFVEKDNNLISIMNVEEIYRFVSNS